MQTIINARQSRNKEVSSKVENIVEDIRERGDTALLEYTLKFDNVELTSKTMRITKDEISESASRIKPELKAAIDEAAKRIRSYQQKNNFAQGLR